MASDNLVKKEIQVFSREKKRLFKETVKAEQAMQFFWGNALGLKFTENFLVKPFLSKIYGNYNDSSLSKHKIESFISEMNIDIHECEKDISEFHCFNDFFARKLKPDARPIDDNENTVVSPGDGRLLVFPRLEKDSLLYVKWAPIPFEKLWPKQDHLVREYAHGSCGILRLCPSDYHRFHFPLAGIPSPTHVLNGKLYSVSPYALEQKLPVYCLNKRTLCTLETKDFGPVLMMEVGALFVGSILQTYRGQTPVTKGQEKGFFKCGGSTVLFFFKEGAIDFDNDLVEQSAKGIETLVKLGAPIARKHVP